MVKTEDRKRLYRFNIDGKWKNIEASDREIVRAVTYHEDLVLALEHLLGKCHFSDRDAEFAVRVLAKIQELGGE